MENISKIADKIIILDNQSDDGTYEKVIKHDKVICKRSNLDFFKYEQYLFAELWSLVRKHAKNEDMILLLSSDEFVDDNLIKNKDELISNSGKTIYFLHLVNMWDKDNFRIDNQWGYRLTSRLFRFIDTDFMEWRSLRKGIHNTFFPSYVKSFYYKAGILNSCLIHYGYSDINIRKRKFEAYFDVSEKKDKVMVSSMMDSNPQLIKLDKLKKLMKNYNIMLSKQEWNEIKRLILN